MREKIKKTLIFLIIIVFIIPYMVMAKVDYSGLYSENGECMNTVLQIGKNDIASNFQIENALEKYCGIFSNEQQRQIQYELFDIWVDNIIKVMDKGAPSSSKDFINTSGKQAYNLWNDNKGQVAELQEFCTAAKKGATAVTTNCTTMGDVNYADDTKGLADIAETFVKNGGFLSSWSQLKTSTEITRMAFDNILSKEQQMQARNIESYADKFKKAYGSVGKAEYYTVSARMTFNATDSISRNRDLGGTLEEKLKFNKAQIDSYYKNYGYNYSFRNDSKSFDENVKNLEEAWFSKIYPNETYSQDKMQQYVEDIIKNKARSLTSKTEEEIDNEYGDLHDDMIYHHPNVKDSENNKTDMDIDKTIKNADEFVSQKGEDGNPENNINTEDLKDFFNPLYNITLIIGIIVAVLVGAILGIKFLTGSVEQKADTKKLLIPYLAGCVAVFGAFGIWKLVVTILADL